MGLSILQWNARSLVAHGGELKQFVYESVVAPDFICIQETWLKPCATFSFPGYSVVRRDRPTAGGGVATLIKTGITYAVLVPPGDMECVSVQFYAGAKRLTIHNVYNPPNVSPIESDYKFLFSFPNSITLGDFNAHSCLFGATSVCTRGLLLESLMDQYSFACLNTGAGTYLKHDGTMSHLDITMVSASISLNSNWMVVDDPLGSDHLPIITTINEAPRVEAVAAERWCYSKANWAAFKSDCRSILIDDTVNDDAEASYMLFVENLTLLANRHIPKAKPSCKARSVPYWNDDCVQAKKARNMAKNRMQATSDLDARIDYRRQKGLTQYVIKNAQKTSWRSYCSSVNDSTKLGTLWKTAKKMSGNTSTPSMASLVENGVKYETNAHKADLLLATFTKASSSSNYTDTFIQHKNSFETEYRDQLHGNGLAVPPSTPHLLGCEEINRRFELHEVMSAVRQCKRHSAAGPDDISYEILKHIPKSCLKVLWKLYNLIWNNGRLPVNWKHSIILPIYKPNKPKADPNSYRPIALTSTLCKIMERVIANRLGWFMERNDLFNRNQCGFRRGKSCLDQIMRLQDDIQKSINTKQLTLAVFIDFEKAFDLVWRDGLLLKLQKLGLSDNIYRFIQDFLTDRSVQVKVGNTLSRTAMLENGSPQGSVISPLLFLLLINDIPLDTDHGSKLAVFADDSSIWKSGPNEVFLAKCIQKYLLKIEAWCDQWGFKISASKTVAVIFTRRVKLKPIALTLMGTQLTFETKFKFLGVIFDNRLLWNAHIDYVVDRCKKSLNLMRALSGKSWGSCKSVLLSLYRSLIRSRIDYGCQAYDTASDASKRRLDSVQYQALKICCGAMKSTALTALQVECGEMSLAERRTQLQLKYAVKIQTAVNHPTSCILEDAWQLHYAKFKTRREPCALKINETLSKLQITAADENSLSEIPPWILNACPVDLALSESIAKKYDSPDLQRALALEFIDKKTGKFALYTDGSKSTDGKVGAAIYAPSIGLRRNVRITDHASVYTSELIAIKCALSYIIDTNRTNSVIFSDSLSVLQTLKHGTPGSNQKLVSEVRILVQQINELDKSNVSFAWVPSHVGVPGNEAADTEAKLALSNPQIDVVVKPTLNDAYCRINSHISEQWQKRWDSSETGKAYKVIQPTVSGVIKYTNKSRRKEVVITRLRLGRCALNRYLHVINCHPTGLCDTCHEPETIEHHLLYCTGQVALADKLRAECATLCMPPTLFTILNAVQCIDVVYDALVANGRAL